MAGVKLSGPLFSGALDRAVQRAIQDAMEQAGTLGVRYVRDVDDATFKNPTGHARSQVVADPLPPNVVRIRDGNVIYRPWLEGVGSRNIPVTRFAGYQAFNKAAHRLSIDVPKLVGIHIGRAVK